MSARKIERIYKVAIHNIHTINGTMCYPRVIEVLTRLANSIKETDESELEDIWYLGETSYECLIDLITGAYWHFVHHSGGQASDTYAAQCALGSIYSPNMECEDEDNGTYQLLESMARDEQS